MLDGRGLRIWIAIVIVAAFPAVGECVVLNQTDLFQGSKDNWTDGHGGVNGTLVTTGGPNGANDSYLQVSSGAFGGESKLITFNQVQWTGNYLAAGVGAISMSLKNFGGSTLPIRIAIRDATGGQTVPGYSSTNAFMLPADGQWHTAQFLLDAADMTPVGAGLPPLSIELTAVKDFRLLSAVQPAFIGDSISARIGVDDIIALPPPPMAMVWTGASSTSFNVVGNWSGGVPGATTGTTNAGTATFNRSATNSPTTIDANRNLENLTFDTASVSALTVGLTAGNALLLTAGGTIQTTSTVANAETINAPLVLEGNYTFTSGATSAAATLTFGGGITPGPTTNTTTLTLNGSNTGTNTIKGVLADNATGLLAVSKSGSGTWILSGANTFSGGTTVSAGILEFDTAPTLSNDTALQVNDGTLRFNVNSGTATVSTGVTVTVASGATLELAGTVAALAAGANRVDITNNSTTPAGILVSGTGQVAGNIGGTGNTQVNAASSLTANHIIQNALVIGGTSTSLGTVIIGPSDPSGNPLVGAAAALGEPISTAPTFAVMPAPSAAFGTERIGLANFGSLASSDPGVASKSLGSAVPEPATLLLLAIGGLAVMSRRRILR
jgi:autotransporter-associated beta strand protein